MSFTQLNWACWGTFLLVWIIGALLNSSDTPPTTTRRARYDWLVLAVPAWLFTRNVPPRYLNMALFHVPVLQIVGAVLLITATLFTLCARWTLGTMWATNAAAREGHALVTNGPYRITRHPIYTGVLGMILGSGLSLGQALIFPGFLVVLLFFLFRIHNEEQLMQTTFGERYVSYMRRVPQLMPGFKPRKAE
jgi:protein-S-isoprenylcysteine O-methyltransferase Ste14